MFKKIFKKGKLWMYFKKRRQAYKNLFLNGEQKLTAEAEVVLSDLKKFCWLEEDNLAPDPNALILAEGRRQVLWRIERFLKAKEKNFSFSDKGEGYA